MAGGSAGEPARGGRARATASEQDALLGRRGRGWPGYGAGLASRASFGYLAPLFRGGRPLRQGDLFDLPHDLRAARNARDAYAAWDARPPARPADARALAAALVASGAARDLFVAAPLKAACDVLSLLRPVIFEWLVAWFAFDAARRDYRVGAAYVALMFLVAFVGDVVLKPRYMALCGNSGVRLDCMLALLLQRKALRVDSASRGSSGRIVSLFSVDSKSLNADTCQCLHMVWSSPFQVIGGFVLLYRLLGLPALAGVLVMLLSTVVASVQCSLSKTCMENRLKWSDKRLRLISEVLTVVRQVKTAGLEAIFERKVTALRNVQMHWIWNESVVEAFGWALWDSLPIVVIAVTFGVVAIVSPELLVPEKVFAALALMEVMVFPVTYAPEVFQNVIQARVSLQRIVSFLNLPEAKGLLRANNKDEFERCAAALRGGTFSWGAQPVLHDPRVEIPWGALTVVTGAVGSGKSSFIAALLGEMNWSGDMSTAHPAIVNAGVISYAPQEPFVFDSSLRDNVVYFADQVDEDWYERVLHACALDRDILEMPEGDKTMLGSKGHQLSGGQKARVALARCVFLRADMYILDSILSSLDTNVARHVFAKVLGPNGLLAGRTRIVVSHNPIAAGMHLHVSNGVITQAKSANKIELFAKSNGVDRAHTKAAELSTDKNSDVRDKSISQRVDDELSEVESSGALGRSLRWYLFFSGATLPVLACAFIVLSQAATLSLDAYLAQWSDAIEGGRINVASQRHVSILLVMCAIASSLQFVRQLVASFGALRVAGDLHEEMLSLLFRAKTRFFDTTPVGTIVNRFSGDINSIDSHLPIFLTAVGSMSTMLMLTSILTLGISPASCIVAIPVAYLYLSLATRFCTAIKELQALASASESPLLTSFEESLDVSGIQVLRASGQTDKHLERFFTTLDGNTRAVVLTTNLAFRYLGVRVAFYGACFVAGVGAACVASASWLSSGVVGLTLIWAFKLTSPLSWLPSLYGMVQTGLVGCERIRSYMSSVPEEAPREKDTDRALQGSGWPQRGHVAVINAKLRYRPELPLAIKGMSFTVPAGSSLGICGRTGAGKSSVMAALLRSVELESGSIEIDSVDVSTIGLRLLRDKVAVLPQDPMLFRATVRENLDPESSCSDAEILAAIERAEASRCVDVLGGLDGFIEDAGQNLSPGERQLLALARILCRHRSSQSNRAFKVLLLDEASASLDYETDMKIQHVIRTWLSDCTMIIIAHRIRTIMSCDRVCVIDDGMVVEGPEEPGVLVRDETSRFAHLARELDKH